MPDGYDYDRTYASDPRHCRLDHDRHRPDRLGRDLTTGTLQGPDAMREDMRPDREAVA